MTLLFVCLGNICRSPAAEAAFAHLIREAGLEDAFELDSAGTGSWHVGERADPRMREAAERRGIPVTSRARQVSPHDFARFDLILAMDQDNLRQLRLQAPAEHAHKIHLFREWDPDSPGDDVPDPYYGGADGFEDVLDIVIRTGRALLEDVRRGAR